MASSQEAAAKKADRQASGPTQAARGLLAEGGSGNGNGAPVAVAGGPNWEQSRGEQVAVNFMSKFRDKDTRVLKNLNSQQFIEVWNNYDKDGE